MEWMTPQEKQALARAEEDGFLVCRPQQKFLIDEWSRRCERVQAPSLRLEKTSGKAQIIVSLAGELSASLQDRCRKRLAEWPHNESLLPIVHRHGLYSQFMKVGDGLQAARSLRELILESSPV